MTDVTATLPRPGVPARTRRALALSGLGVTLTVVAVAGLGVGARDVAPGDVVAALLSPDLANPDHLVIRAMRLPRAGAGVVLGATLAVAGLLMQALTRNPLADPGLLGVNAGASAAVVLAIAAFGLSAPAALVWFAFAGAGAVAALVWALGTLGAGSATPVRLALAGAAVSGLLMSLVTALLLLSHETLQGFRFWMVGSLAGATPAALAQLVPAFAAGFALALWSGAALNAVALGDDAARALGVRLGAARAAALAAITLLCGAAVALAGPIGFVGLVVPHLARALMGPDQRWCLPAAALMGPILLLAADCLGRIVLRPDEVQVGVMTALIGGPAFVVLLRRIRVMQP